MPRSAQNPKRSPRRSGAVLVLLTPDERDEIRAAAERDDRPLTAWIRRVALREAREQK
jgi:uncharacterized protein (DUF1778 family)